uniref:Uncharacterized protein n=1 Tax=Molossus molossus TaxID=27622 RepID=A0A7J8DPS1_MOLMO|nr:hypothetical protein HJG59_009246 [Molossus molossus]
MPQQCSEEKDNLPKAPSFISPEFCFPLLFFPLISLHGRAAVRTGTESGARLLDTRMRKSAPLQPCTCPRFSLAGTFTVPSGSTRCGQNLPGTRGWSSLLGLGDACGCPFLVQQLPPQPQMQPQSFVTSAVTLSYQKVMLDKTRRYSIHRPRLREVVIFLLPAYHVRV